MKTSMKKNMLWMALMSVLLVGCEESADVRSARGLYSYKSSGIVEIDSIGSVSLTEQGSMEVISLQNEDSVLLTFNELAGGVYSAYASIKGDEITLSPFTRQLSDKLLINPVEVRAEGSGRVYNGSLILELHYTGKTKEGLRVESEKIELIARKNK